MCAEIVADTGSLPLCRYPIAATTRDDEAAEIISHYLRPVHITKVVEPRRFRLDMNGQHLGRLFIGFNRFATDTIVEPGRIEGAVVITLGYSRRRPSFIDLDDERVSVSPDTAAVLSPTRRVRNFRLHHSGLFKLAISTSVLAEHFFETVGASISGPIVFAPSVDVTKGSGRLLRELIHGLASDLDNNGVGPENAVRHALLEDALISVVLNLPGAQSHTLADIRGQELAPWVVRRAEEFMVAHVSDPIAMSDLVVVCGCSRSALFDAFKSSRGYTPMQFLASRRLELARKQLIQKPEATATEIALDCGFGNYGRFAKAYCSRFGESPAATHARYHGPMRR